MVDNTARNLYTTAAPAVEPEQKPAAAPRVAPVHKTRVAISPFEGLLLTVAMIAITAFALVSLSAQYKASATSEQFQKTERTIANTNKSIANSRQAISELTATSRLNAFAKAHGMTVIGGSIKQVVK